jgi:hypothetical protein
VQCSVVRKTVQRSRTDQLLDRFVVDEASGQRVQMRELVEGAGPNSSSSSSSAALHHSTSGGAAEAGELLDGRARTLSFQWPSLADNKSFRVTLIKSFSFNVWDHSDNDLFRFTVGIFQEMGLMETVGGVCCAVLCCAVLCCALCCALYCVELC